MLISGRKIQMKLSIYISAFLLILMLINGFASTDKADIDKKVNDLLSKMTLEEKVGQMTQVAIQVVSSQKGTVDQKHQLDSDKLNFAILEKHVGSILNVYDIANNVDYWHEIITKIQDVATKKTRLKIPVLYGIDAIHGANYTKEAVLFPQSIAMAASRNLELVEKSAAITAYEVRASGIPWNFNPVLGVGRTPLWSRLFETFGEDPYLVSQMGEAYINGMEGKKNNISSQDKVAACMKHYLGYSFPLSGKDRTPAWIPERMLREIFLPPFKKAVESGVHTVMINSGDINGIPVHSSYKYLTAILKNELGFKGLVVSDWADIVNLYSRDKVAESLKEAVRMGVMAGIDMSMVPYDFSFYDLLLELVKEGTVPEARINDAVFRILKVKMELGLFKNSYPVKKMKNKIGSSESIAISLQAAREALTLLKNDKILPLKKEKKEQKILVTGPNANLLSVLNGGWSYTWQGNEENFYPKNKMTILQAIEKKAGKENVVHVQGTAHNKEIDVKKAVDTAKESDVIIACIGEPVYCETPGNIDDLSLPDAQLNLVKQLQKTGKPVVLVLVEGRPRIITPVVENSAAILMAYLPGNEGGTAIADVLFGDCNPSGKLPITYPRNVNDLVCYDYKPNEIDDANKHNPLYDFGHGLSYTIFEYVDLKISENQIKTGDQIKIEVTIKNSGEMAGKETVELYLSDLVRSVTPPVRQLKRFKKVHLKPGESKTVEFTLSEEDLMFYGREGKFITEPGEFKVMIGNLSQNFILVN